MISVGALYVCTDPDCIRGAKHAGPCSYEPRHAPPSAHLDGTPRRRGLPDDGEIDEYGDGDGIPWPVTAERL